MYRLSLIKNNVSIKLIGALCDQFHCFIISKVSFEFKKAKCWKDYELLSVYKITDSGLKIDSKFDLWVPLDKIIR